MATRDEYLAKGYTDQQINNASMQKNLTAVGSGIDGYVAPVPTTPVAPVAPVNNIGGLSTTQAQGVQDIYKNNIAGGMTPLQAQDAIKADPNFAKAKEQYNAPVATTTPVSTTPVAPTPTAPQVNQEKTTVTTPEGVTSTVKETPTVNMNTSEGRQQEVLDNLNNAYGSGATTPEQLKSFAGYDQADAGKKAMIDSFIQAKDKQMKEVQANSIFGTQDGIFSAMQTGQIVPDRIKVTPAYAEAKKRIDNVAQFASFTPPQFASAFQNGDLLPGTQTYKDLIKDPGVKMQIDKANLLNSINGKALDTNRAVKNVMEDIMTSSPLGQALRDGFISAEEANKLTTTPEIQALNEKALTLKNDYDTKLANYNDIRNSVENELKGKDVTAGYKEALIGQRSRDMKVGLDIATSLYNNTIGALSDQKKEAANLFETNLGLYQEQKRMQAGKEELAQKQAFQRENILQAQGFQSRQDERNFTQQLKLGEIQNQYQNSRDVQNYKQDLQKMGITDEMQTNRDKLNFAQQKELTAIQNKYKDSSDVKDFDRQVSLMNAKYNIENYIVPNEPVKPTGNIINQKIGTKNISLDEAAMPYMANAYEEMKAAGLNPLFGAQQFRTKEDQQKLYNAYKAGTGGLAAPPGQSLHEKGLSVDLYDGDPRNKPNPQQIAIMNKNGWYQTAGSSDLGHFDFKGNIKSGGASSGVDKTPQFKEYLNKGSLPTGIKSNSPSGQAFLQEYNQWKKNANPVTESAQKRVDTAADDYTKNINVSSAFKFAPIMRTYSNKDISKMSSSDRQGIISDYAKALDPDSVVREGEYATVAKYSSSWSEKTLSEIKQALDGNGTLSDAAAKKVIDAIMTRGKSYMEQENNVRKQYVQKINKITGNQDGESQLIFPDYSMASNGSTGQSQMTKVNPNSVDDILNAWKNSNQ